MIQQITVKHGIPEGTVRIKSRIETYEDLGEGRGVARDALGRYQSRTRTCRRRRRRVVADPQVPARARRRRGGFAASAAPRAGHSTTRRRASSRETRSDRRAGRPPLLGFTCYAALAPHRASNIEDVSYQILLGEKKYFVSTDGGGERQQWFALIREPAGGVDPEPTPEDPTPKLTRLRKEFADAGMGDADGNVWDPFALELINASEEGDIKRRDLYDGARCSRRSTRSGSRARGPRGRSRSAATRRTR